MLVIRNCSLFSGSKCYRQWSGMGRVSSRNGGPLLETAARRPPGDHRTFVHGMQPLFRFQFLEKICAKNAGRSGSAGPD